MKAFHSQPCDPGNGYLTLLRTQKEDAGYEVDGISKWPSSNRQWLRKIDIAMSSRQRPRDHGRWALGRFKTRNVEYELLILADARSGGRDDAQSWGSLSSTRSPVGFLGKAVVYIKKCLSWENPQNKRKHNLNILSFRHLNQNTRLARPTSK